jgi:hypothetical protein
MKDYSAERSKTFFLLYDSCCIQDEAGIERAKQEIALKAIRLNQKGYRDCDIVQYLDIIMGMIRRVPQSVYKERQLAFLSKVESVLYAEFKKRKAIP